MLSKTVAMSSKDLPLHCLLHVNMYTKYTYNIVIFPLGTSGSHEKQSCFSLGLFLSFKTLFIEVKSSYDNSPFIKSAIEMIILKQRVYVAKL